MTTENDPVHRPAHYANTKIEVANFIADRKLDYFLGNVVKYVSRAGIKDPATELEDLEKAQAYLAMRIRMVKGDEPISEFERNIRSSHIPVTPVAPVKNGHVLVIPKVDGIVYLFNLNGPMEAARDGIWAVTKNHEIDLHVRAQPTAGHMFVDNVVHEWDFLFRPQDSQPL